MTTRTILLSTALSALLLAAPRVAWAQDAEDAEITRMAKEHYKLGLDAFKAAKYPEAIKELKKAYLLKRLPPLLVNIAKTYEKLNDVDNEIYYYKKYLAETPPDAKDREQIKAALADAEERKAGKNKPPEEEPAEAPTPGSKPRKGATPPPEEAPPPTSKPRKGAPPPAEEPEAPPPTSKPRKGATPPPTEEPAGPAAPAQSQEWNHTPIDAAPPGRPVDVRVQTPVMKGVKVFLNYRGRGQADFTSLEMKRKGAEKVGRIPSDMMNGKSIQYYIEAKDATGNVLKNSGSQADPNIIMIDASAKALIADGPGEEAEPTTSTGPAEQPKPTEDEPPPLTEEDRRRQEQARLKRGTTGDDKSGKPGGKLLTTMGFVGLGVAALGVLIAGVGTPLCFGLSGGYAQAVHDDANASPLYVFNDPGASPNDSDFQDRGHLLDIMGFVTLGVGVAAIAAGGVIALMDYMKLHPSAPKAKKAIKKKKKKRRVVEEEEGGEEVAPPADDVPPDASLPSTPFRNFVAAPIIGPHTYGFGAGFSF